MDEKAHTSDASGLTIPADDPTRKLTVADPDGPDLRHVAVVGDT